MLDFFSLIKFLYELLESGTRAKDKTSKIKVNKIFIGRKVLTIAFGLIPRENSINNSQSYDNFDKVRHEATKKLIGRMKNILFGSEYKYS